MTQVASKLTYQNANVNTPLVAVQSSVFNMLQLTYTANRPFSQECIGLDKQMKLITFVRAAFQLEP